MNPVTKSIIKKAGAIGFPAYLAVGEYQQARAEGTSKVGSVIRAGTDFALSEAMGPGYILYQLGKSAPSMAVSGYLAIDSLSRQNRSHNANLPFANSRFQDSTPAYTMRQAGMELAKASRYNLEQSLMGNEASHFKL